MPREVPKPANMDACGGLPVPHLSGNRVCCQIHLQGLSKGLVHDVLSVPLAPIESMHS